MNFGLKLIKMSCFESTLFQTSALEFILIKMFEYEIIRFQDK